MASLVKLEINGGTDGTFLRLSSKILFSIAGNREKARGTDPNKSDKSEKNRSRQIFRVGRRLLDFSLPEQVDFLAETVRQY